MRLHKLNPPPPTKTKTYNRNMIVEYFFINVLNYGLIFFDFRFRVGFGSGTTSSRIFGLGGVGLHKILFTTTGLCGALTYRRNSGLFLYRSNIICENYHTN